MLVNQGDKAKHKRWPCKESYKEKTSSEINYHSKGKILNPLDNTYLLRVTMISPERNMPDELAPSINSLNNEMG